jgi:ABC-2 type transport system permease protein
VLSFKEGDVSILRSYMLLAGASLRSQLQYRTNCITMIMTGLIWQGTGFVFIWIILSQFHDLAGWTLGEIAFLYGFRLISHAGSMLLFGIFHRVEFLIRLGDFDRFLTSPIPPLIFVMTYEFPIPALGDLLGGIIIFAVATPLVHVHWTLAAVIYGLIALMGGCLIDAGVKLAVSSLAFRTLSSFYLVSFFDDAMSLTGNYPLTIFGGAVRFFLTFILPVAFLAYFPVVVLLQRTNELSVSPLFAFLSPVVGIIIFTFACFLFQAETRHYQSAGH